MLVAKRDFQSAVGKPWKLPLNLVAADVRRLRSISDFGFRILKNEPPHVGCYGSGVQCAKFFGGYAVANEESLPPHPIPLPLGGGEGARRAGEGPFSCRPSPQAM